MLYFRVDMNDKIATGHIMRCLSIADAAKAKGANSTFILADDNAAELIKNRGYESIVLNSKWNDLEYELHGLHEVIRKNRIERILIDSYSVTADYFNAVSKMTDTFYIDDINAFHYTVNGIICYASYYRKFEYERHYPDTKLLLGSCFAPLRPEFSDCRPKTINSSVKRLLIMSGGADDHDIVSKLIEQVADKGYEIFAICGTYNNSCNCLISKYRSNPLIHVLKNTPNIKQYMDWADLAISAAGSTLYELSATGTPTISYTLADNQLYNAKQFNEDGIIPYSGDARTEDVVKTVVQLIDSVADSNLRRDLSIEMQRMVDGKGATRIAEELLK